MTLLAFPCRPCELGCSSARSRVGRLNPSSSAKAPAWRVSRRVRPSQHLRGLPKIVIIGLSPQSFGVPIGLWQLRAFLSGVQTDSQGCSSNDGLIHHLEDDQNNFETNRHAPYPVCS